MRRLTYLPLGVKLTVVIFAALVVALSVVYLWVVPRLESRLADAKLRELREAAQGAGSNGSRNVSAVVRFFCFASTRSVRQLPSCAFATTRIRLARAISPAIHSRYGLQPPVGRSVDVSSAMGTITPRLRRCCPSLLGRSYSFLPR